MPRIDPSIFFHDIRNYPYANPIRQKHRHVHPRKEVSIKEEIEKVLMVGFIYPVPLTEWIYSIIPINKKQGTIRFCIDFRDLNWACRKENFPNLYID